MTIYLKVKSLLYFQIFCFRVKTSVGKKTLVRDKFDTTNYPSCCDIYYSGANWRFWCGKDEHTHSLYKE